MRHSSFFNEIVEGRHFIEGLVNSLGQIEDHIFCEMLLKKRLIMDYIQMIVYEFFLDSSVVALNNTVDLRAPWIYKHMRNISLSECLIEVSKIL